MDDEWISEWRNASGVIDDTADGAPADEDHQSGETTELDLGPATADTSATQPKKTRRSRTRDTGTTNPRSRRVLYPLAALVGLLVVVIIGVLALTGGRDDGDQQAGIAIPSQDVLSTQATPSVASPITCTETNTPTRLVTNGPGDTGTAPGLIAAFEHAYFTERDPIAAAERLDPSMRVTSGAIRGVMDANFPPGTDPVPYCATITPWSATNTWAVSVDWVDERTDEVKTWTAVYEVKTVNGQLRITSQRNA